MSHFFETTRKLKINVDGVDDIAVLDTPRRVITPTGWRYRFIGDSLGPIETLLLDPLFTSTGALRMTAL